MALPSAPRIVICGCGNAAHLLLALLTRSLSVPPILYASYADESSRLQSALSSTPLTIHNPPPYPSFSQKIDTNNITKDPKCVKDADLILLPLPAFAVKSVLDGIVDYVKEGAWIGVMPGQGGFQWPLFSIFGGYQELMKRKITVFSMDKLPYNVRIMEFGKEVKVYGYKWTATGSIPVGNETKVVEGLKKWIPYFKGGPMKGGLLGTTLAMGNQCIHPARMYGLDSGGDLEKGVWKKRVLFYDEMDKESIERIKTVGDEIMQVARGMEKHVKGLDLSEVKDVKEALVDAYGEDCEDTSSLEGVLKRNKGFKGIYSPMVERKEGGWIVDWNSRYLTDDVPYGLCVVKGLAELAQVNTPTVDMLIEWAQKHWGKEYLKDGKLCGKDVLKTGAPQAFGFKKLEELPDIKSVKDANEAPVHA